MTNAQIIFNAEQALAEQGLIKYTGNVIKAQDLDGNPIDIKETEAIHTFQCWKNMGYSVVKGQKAVVKLTIWKHSAAKMMDVPTEDGMVQVLDEGKMFMKTASFFAAHQVAKTEK